MGRVAGTAVSHHPVRDGDSGWPPTKRVRRAESSLPPWLPGHGPALTAAEALTIAEADLAYLRAIRGAVVAARDDRARARAAAIAVPLPRTAPDELAEMHAGNAEMQLVELLPHDVEAWPYSCPN